MLRERILPSGIGHTTNCFIQVGGSENGESYLISEDSTDKKNVNSGEYLTIQHFNLNSNRFVFQFLSWRIRCALVRLEIRL